MVGTANPQLVFVHGIGGLRNAEAERQQWLRALATGVRAAERPELVSALTQDWLAESRFADYSGLFNPRGAQGGAPSGELDPSDEQVLSGLLAAMMDELAEQYPADTDTRDARVIEQARHQLDAVSSGSRAQGVGEFGRRLVGVTTTLLQLPGLRQGTHWLSGQAFAMHLSQVARYLNRHGERASLGAAIRSRVLEGVDPTRPLVVVSHSLGTVVTYEALHEYEGSVALWVTLGSPLALGGVVLQRLVPRPPSCPEGVGVWHNFWDRNDVVVGRPRLAEWIAPSSKGVKAQTAPVESSGVWTHTATKYLEHAEVARPIVEALVP
jgi:hypothetical protein